MTKSIQEEKSKSKVRNSNIEILRIISMFLIVMFHFLRNVHVGPENTVVYVLITVLSSWGILGVDLFLIISAWFLSNQQFRIKKVIHIIFQTFTWVAFYSVLFLLYDFFRLHNSMIITIGDCFRNLVKGFLDPFFSSAYWFITAYFFMLLLSPLLNKLLNTFDQSKIKKLLLLFIFVPNICTRKNECSM